MGGGLLFLDQDVIGTRWMWAGLGLHKVHTLAAAGTAEQSKAVVQRKVSADCLRLWLLCSAWLYCLLLHSPEIFLCYFQNSCHVNCWKEGEM